MQAAKNAAETIKETAANIGASAMSGLEKTKASVQEKSERMSASDPMQKDMATEKKEERINQAEIEKQEAREHNAVAKESATDEHVTESHYTATTGPVTETATHHPTAGNQMPAMHGPGHDELLNAPGSGPNLI